MKSEIKSIENQKEDQIFAEQAKKRIAKMEKQLLKAKLKRAELFKVAETNDPYGLAMEKADRLSKTIMKKIEKIEEWQIALDVAQKRLEATF